MKQADAALERFMATVSDKPPLTFAVMYIIEMEYKLNITQDFYLSKIGLITYKADLSDLSSVTMKLAQQARTGLISHLKCLL